MSWPEWLIPSASWLPALAVNVYFTLVIGVIAKLFWPYYRAKIEKSVQHNLDKKLEDLRSKLRIDEEAAKASFRARDEQIAALRSGALSGMATRHAAVDKRRLEAVEKLWAAVVVRSSLKSLSKMTMTLNMNAIVSSSNKHDRDSAAIKDFVDVIWKVNGLDNLKDLTLPDSERPFLSPLSWAMYSLYSQLLMHPYAQLAAVKYSLGEKLLAEPNKIISSLIEALPHQKLFIDTHGADAFPHLVDEVEQILLNELIASLYGADEDQKNIKQASQILKAASDAKDLLNRHEVEISIPQAARK